MAVRHRYSGHHRSDRARKAPSIVNDLREAQQELREELEVARTLRDSKGVVVRQLPRESSTLLLSREEADRLDPAYLRRFLDEHNLTLFLED